MCIALFTKPEVIIDEKTLKNCSDNNKDGCGLSYVVDNKVVVYKTLDFKEFIYEYNQVTKKYSESPKLIHFRKQTKGKISIDNCHPFQISETMSFIHNGTITSENLIIEGDESDTKAFCKDFLQQFPEGWQNNEAILSMIEDFIGTSRLILLEADYSYTILNEDSGHWNNKKEVWYSNWSYYPNTPSIQKYKPTKAQIQGYKSEKKEYSNQNNFGFWKCIHCGKNNFNWESSCACRRGFQPKDSLSKVCPKCFDDCNKIAKYCPTCYHEFFIVGCCSFCGEDEEISFTTTWDGKSIKLCSRCEKILRKESDIYFPKSLFEKNLMLVA